MNSQGNHGGLLGTKVTWEHLGHQMAQENTLRTAMISESLTTVFPKEHQRTVTKGPMTHVWKGTDNVFAGLTEETGLESQARSYHWEGDRKGTCALGLFLASGMSQQPMSENRSVNQRSDSPPSRWPERVIIYNVGTEENAWSSHRLHASWDGEQAGLAFIRNFQGCYQF